MTIMTQDLAEVKPTPPAVFSGAESRRRELYDAWLAGRKPATLRSYAGDCADFARFAGQASPAAAAEWLFGLDSGTANLVALRYRASLVEQGLAAATIARRLAALRSLSQLARMIGACSWVLEVEAPEAEPCRDTLGPGAAGYARIRQAASADGSDRGVRDLAIVLLAHDLGLRRGEICGLDLEHVEVEEGRAVAVSILGKGKSGRQRLTLPDPTGRALLAWVARRGDQAGPLFQRTDRAGAGTGRLTGEAVRLVVARLSEAAGLGRTARPHGLRHQAITAVLDANNGDLRAAARFSRHAKLETLQRYDDNRTDLAGAMARLIAGE